MFECTTDSFLTEFREPNYLLLGSEIRTNARNQRITYLHLLHKDKILLKHNICDHKFEVFPTKFLQGQRCPKCSRSYGEVEIMEFLSARNVNFVQQYWTKDCKYINYLLFDFAIFDNEENLLFLVEYQGKQHYKPVEYWGGEEAFRVQQIKDRIKRNYCKSNDLRLIEIPYWHESKIAEILTNELGLLVA